MPTNPNVLVNRSCFIGGSEISTILNINPFKTRWDLMQEKAEILRDEFQGNVYTQYGEEMEPKIRDYINVINPDKFREDTIIEKHEILSFRCNYDGLGKYSNLEIKTTSAIYEDVREYKKYIVQLLWGMILGNLQEGILAVYERKDINDKEFHPEQLHLYYINRADYQDWEEEIITAVEKFVKDVERLKENPYLNEADFASEQVVLLANKIEKLENQLKAYDIIKEQYEELRSQLYEAMYNNDVKSWSTNTITISRYDAQADKIIEKEVANLKRLKEIYPNIYNEIVEVKKETKKGRKGYITIRNKEEKYEY